MEIERDILQTLKAWKESANRKPVLLMGARQIGKTWAMEKLGKENFDYYVRFDFDRQPELRDVFQISKSPDRILKELALYSSVPLKAGKTLIIFDEIQECEEALNSLKYFCEEAPEYHILAAGSLLGVAVKRKRMAVPVGKVHIIRMYPISFIEFLRASDRDTYDYASSIAAAEPLPLIILNKLTTEYRRYMVSGGMPVAARAMIEGAGMGEIDNLLQEVLDLYEMDFAKYAEPREIPRIVALWHSLPAQLAKENRKFIYNVIKSGARSKDYEDALLWLEDAGIIHRVYNITKPGMPLAAYEDTGAFKVYASDCGLLRRLAGLPPSAIISGNSEYTEFKGAMAENCILQALLKIAYENSLHYWSKDSRAEIEFVMQNGEDIIPIEVKADTSISGRSITTYDEKYHPRHRVRFSLQNMQYNGNMLSCPSPLAEWYPRYLPKKI